MWNVYENVKRAERKSSYCSSAYHDTCPVFYILLPEMGCSTAKVSRLHKYIKSRAVRKFPYILWRIRNYFVIEIERIECVYDCVCDLSQLVLFPC